MNTSFVPFTLMLNRLQKAKEDSDTTYFYDLLLFAEQMEKITVSALVSGVEEDKSRAKYTQLHRLVRADGIGEWHAVLIEIMTGPTSQFLNKSITANEQKELQTKLSSGSWQYDSVFYLNEVLAIVGLNKQELPIRVQATQWFMIFSQLRNGTKGHGAVLPSNCSRACEYLERSIGLFMENFFLFKREWVFLHQNLNGKYRVTKLNKTTSNFDELKIIQKFSSLYQNGVYIFFDKRSQVELVYSNPEADDFFLPNGNFRQKGFELISYITNRRLEGDSSLYLTPVKIGTPHFSLLLAMASQTTMQ